jgi:hypothetical protein
MIPVYQNETRALFKTDNSAVAAEFNAAITRGDDAFIEYEGKKYRVLSASDEDALACHSIPIGPLLKRFLHRYLPRAAAVGYGEGPFHHDVECGGLRGARGSRAPSGIAAAALAEPAAVRRCAGAGLVVHDAGSSGRGLSPVRADQRLIATST